MGSGGILRPQEARMFVGRLELGRTDLLLRFGPNHLAAGFFSAMSVLHAAVGVPGLVAGKFEGELSMALAAALATIALICWAARVEVALRADERTLNISIFLGRNWLTRRIPFDQVVAVRLLLGGKRDRIQIACPNEDIECPVTAVPTQQVLCMAMTMGVRMIRMHTQPVPMAAERINRIAAQNERGNEGLV
jgi:hypothetical protein